MLMMQNEKNRRKAVEDVMPKPLNKTPTRQKVLAMLGAEAVNLSVIYARTGLTRQSVLRVFKDAHQAGLCVLALERRRPRAEEYSAFYKVRITEAGLRWLEESEADASEVCEEKPCVVQRKKYATVDRVLPGAALLQQAW